MTNLYSVSYNTNNTTGGTTPPTQSASSNSTTYSFKLPEQGDMVKTGYTFMGWAESPDAPVQQYDGGATIELSGINSNKTLYAIWGLTYSIQYNLDGGTGTAPASQTLTIARDPYEFTVSTASQENMVKPGYSSNGWTTQRNGNVALTKVVVTKAEPNKVLYPVWNAVDWNSMTRMQQMTPTICSNASSEKTLIDTRDGSSYTVKKLSDTKCWMTQNLRIVNKAITSADSDVSSNYTIPASSSPWSDTSATTNKVHYANDTTYGAYYTWYTATAGTGNSSITTAGQNASSSICPKGWRLPTSGSSGEFQALVNKGKSSWTTNNSKNGYWLGGTSSTASGAAFFPAGGFVQSGLHYAGSNGYYWTSTALNGTHAYRLYFDSSNVNPSNDYYRYFGMSVRCVAK